MPLTLFNGRTIEALLTQNTADGSVGNEIEITNYIKEDGLGDISWEVDENLTKLDLGTIQISLTDDPDAGNPVRTFLNNSLVSSLGLLPPWFVLNIDGAPAFVGLVKESPDLSESAEDSTISFTATSWASMLDKKRVALNDPNFIRYSPKDSIAYSQGPTIQGRSVYNKELRRNHDRTMVAVAASENANFKVGDWVYFANYSSFSDYNKKYPIIGKQVIDVGGLGTSLALYLGGGFWWKELPGDIRNGRQESSLYRIYQATSDLPSYIVDESFDPQTDNTKAKLTIKLQNVDGIIPGDKLEKVSNYLNANDSPFTVTVTDVDPTDRLIYIESPLNSVLTAGVTSLSLSKESSQDSVFMPTRLMLEKALLGLGQVDYTHYQPATLADLSLGFISPNSSTFQNTRTGTISGASDLQPSLTEVEFLGQGGLAWTGLPALGWEPTTWAKKVNWTNQVSTAPAYLMPYYPQPSDRPAGEEKKRNRTKPPGTQGWEDDSTLPPATGISYKTVYDYSNKRYYQFKYSSTVLSIQVYTWNGSIWTLVSGFTNPTNTNFIEALPFKDCASSVGAGYGLLALYADNTVKTILSTVNLSVALDNDAKAGVTLVQTPNGIYYLTETGYGRIYIEAGVLKQKYTKIFNPNKIQKVTLIPSTFVFSNGHVVALAKAAYKVKITDERWTEDTYLFQLTADPQATPKDSVISYDFITKNIPRATMAVKSPVSDDIIGLMGSRIFCISKTLPDTIERFNTGNKKASSLVEYVTTITNTVAFPLVWGGLKLYTRGYNEAPVSITVNQESINETTWNKHLANCIIIKGYNTDQPGVAISTTQRSGNTFQYTNEMLIRNSSQANAIARAYLAFFEIPRKEMEQVWFWDQDGPAPWETFEPFKVITINGGTDQYYVTGVSWNLVTQKATIKLLEKV